MFYTVNILLNRRVFSILQKLAWGQVDRQKDWYFKYLKYLNDVCDYVEIIRERKNSDRSLDK